MRLATSIVENVLTRDTMLPKGRYNSNIICFQAKFRIIKYINLGFRHSPLELMATKGWSEDP